jgi:hypothetical protein
MKITIIQILIFCSLKIWGQNIYIPPKTNEVDSSVYVKYLSLLRISFVEDSVETNRSAKHNIFIAYNHLNAPIDTVLKYAYKSIEYDPVGECESACKKTSYTYAALNEKHPKKWREVCQYCDSIFSKFNLTLMDTLRQISENDQLYRKDTNLLSAGSDSDIWKKQKKLDINDLKIVEKIFSEYGYPGKRLVGIDLSDVAFIVIQHSDVEKQEKYLPIIQKAVENRDLDKVNLPYLIDRIRMNRKQPQIYGTQLIWNKKKEKLELYPVEDIENVDIRRDKMNLTPLREYLKDNNITEIYIKK